VAVSTSTKETVRRATSSNKGVPLILRFYHRRIAYILAVPLVLYEAIFLFYPMAEGVRDSLSNVETGSTTQKWVGLANYQRMLSDPVFWQTIQNTVVYAVSVIVLALTVALGTALLMNRPFRGRPIFRAVLTTPWAFPDIPTAIAFVWMMSPPNDVLGEIARWIPGVHTTPLWLQDPLWALVSIVLISVWKGFPFYALVILAALQGVPAEIYEAAKVDGANAWHRFRSVTYPGILPTLMLLALLAFIFSFQQFTLIWKTTGGGPVNATQTISIMIYNTAFQFFDYSYASAIGVAGFVLSMLAAVLFVFLERRVRAAEGR